MTPNLSRRDAIKLIGAGTLLAAAEMTPGAPAAPANNPAASLGGYKDGQYVLPPLPYAFDALQPQLDARTLEIHHDRHHAGYVRGLNATLEKLEAARKAGDFAAVQALSRALAFNGSGHVLHCLLWQSMTPGGAAIPDELARTLAANFGSVEAAKAQFAAAAKAVEASGWAVLAYEPMAGELLVLQAEKHQDLTVWGVTPLLACDVWEHAYYLQYQNRRADWVDAFMTIANWPTAARRLAAVKG